MSEQMKRPESLPASSISAKLDAIRHNYAPAAPDTASYDADAVIEQLRIETLNRYREDVVLPRHTRWRNLREVLEQSHLPSHFLSWQGQVDVGWNFQQLDTGKPLNETPSPVSLDVRTGINIISAYSRDAQLRDAAEYLRVGAQGIAPGRLLPSTLLDVPAKRKKRGIKREYDRAELKRRTASAALSRANFLIVKMDAIPTGTDDTVEVERRLILLTAFDNSGLLADSEACKQDVLERIGAGSLSIAAIRSVLTEQYHRQESQDEYKMKVQDGDNLLNWQNFRHTVTGSRQKDQDLMEDLIKRLPLSGEDTARHKHKN